VAGRARLGDDGARAPALPAGARDREKPLLVSQLATAMALRTGGRRRALGRARATAGLAGLLPRNLNRRLEVRRRFFERDLEVVAKIGAALWSAAPSASAEDVGESKDVPQATEDVLETGEDIRIEAGGGGAAEPSVTEAVVHVALVGVRQDGVSLGRLLELLLGRVVARVAIGMVGQRKLAVCALDLLLRRRPRDGQYLVVVALAHDDFATFTIAGRNSRSPRV
jgi:hypothetical protein